MVECSIILDNEEFPYLPGQTIQGKLKCNFENDNVVKGWYLYKIMLSSYWLWNMFSRYFY